MPEVECEHCGGTDFYKEAGFYYCKECQVQSQDIQEHVFQDNFIGDDDVGAGRTRPPAGSRRLKKDESQKTENKITSWECYNYILLALCEELIALGAQRRLKQVVKLLWLRYLDKVEVIKLAKEDLPRLQAVNSARDAEIIYGKRLKRKRKKPPVPSVDENDPANLDATFVKSMRIKKKRALIRSHYEHFTQSQQTAVSAHQNETLTTLRSSDKSATAKVLYNRFSVKELRRKQSVKHIRKHCMDLERELKCHKATYRNVSYKYRTSPHLLSLNKLYAILYLGLLIIQDNITLSDIIRFIEEGNLSFNSYTHTFPEDFSDKKVNFRNSKKNRVFANAPMRRITREMAQFLQVEQWVPRPNLVRLCERFCTELNLPLEICVCVKKIMAKCALKMDFKQGLTTPNYEGRVVSLIICVLKMLFGLDGVSEFNSAEYTDILNRDKSDFFNIVSWLKFLDSRRSFYKKLSTENHVVVGLLTRKIYPELMYNKYTDNYSQVLGRLAEKVPQNIGYCFVKTLTPMLDFTENNNFINKQLFQNSSVVHILHPHVFTNIANDGENPKWVHGSGNIKWILEPIIGADQQKKICLRERQKPVTIKLGLKKTKIEQSKPKLDGNKFRQDYLDSNKFQFKQNRKTIQNLRALQNFPLDDIRQRIANLSGNSYKIHLNPFESYWLRTVLQSQCLNTKECDAFVEKYPCTFKVLFEECCAMLHQTRKEFLTEFQLTELHLVYGRHFRVKSAPNRAVQDFLQRTSRVW